MDLNEERLKELEEEIYTDLTPVQKAAQALSKKLPEDGRILSDEAWHFFHFETEDFATMKRTIELACQQYHDWKYPELVSIEKFLQKVDPNSKGKAVNISKEQIAGVLASNDKIIHNHRLFVYSSYFDAKNDNSASKISSNLNAFRLMEAMVTYCSEERHMQNKLQNRNAEAFCDNREVPYYNRVFFISYGSSCVLPDNLRTSLCTISYSSLLPEDYRCLLWEYHLRRERARQAVRKKRGLPPGKMQNLILDQKLLEWYANRMAGLDEIMVRRLLSSMDGAFANNYADYTDKDSVDKIIIEYKNDILRQHGRLEVIEVNKDDKVTGLDTVQRWLDEHKTSVKSYGESPTGILLVGIPGTGKSATAKEAAKRLELPLVQLDMSRILGGRVGDSEKGMREMLDDLQFVAPCILWIDEVEKAMSGADGKSGDGGTIKRLFGMLLTFIQDNERPVFTVTTANDISNLPPEFFRNGRFNQTFCLMMPRYKECIDIMRLKLDSAAEKLGLNHKFSDYEAGRIFDQCVGTPERPRFLTGADIEAHVQELFWRYRDGMLRIYSEEKKGQNPDISPVAEKMREVAREIRVQALPAAKYTMDDIARRYLDMIQRGITLAGDPEANNCFSRDHFDIDRICYYNYENDEKKDDLPFCLTVPKEYEHFKNVKKLSDQEKKSPFLWYDKVFFYELNRAMSRIVFQDRDLTMEEARREYWELMKHLKGSAAGRQSE